MKKKMALSVLGGALLLGALSSCGYATPAADQIGLYYNQGWAEGKNFDHVVEPGTSDDSFAFNDVVIYLPTSLRTWNVSTDDGADQKSPIIVPTKDGVLVNVWSQANMVLNSNNKDVKDFPGGTIRRFWESIGARYAADSDDGWRKMMLVTVVPALEKATRDVVREYDADPLVYNTGGIMSEVQGKIGEHFLTELKRLSGGEFFCGPTFVRGKNTCPAPELIVKDVDFNNSGIQQARDDRRKAAEQSAAKLAEAQGMLDAQAKLNAALKDPNYLRYLEAQMQLEAAKACAASSNCVLVQGSSPVNVNTK